MIKILETMFISALPIIELRGALPIAILSFKMQPLLAYVVCVVGSFLPIFPIVYWLGPVSDFLRKHIKFFDIFFKWLFKYAREKHAKKFAKLKDLTVFILAAIPLPLFGVWSAGLMAFVFDIPPKKSIPLIFAGTLVAGAIVLFLSVGFKAVV